MISMSMISSLGLTFRRALVFLLLAAPPLAAQDVPIAYRIDPVHSELTFRIRHLVSRVTGTFERWQGTITVVPGQWDAGQVAVTIDAASISTNNERRDNDLRSDNFFDVATYPSLTFTSTRVEATGTALRIFGDLTIRGITKPVVLDGEYTGATAAGTPNERLGFQASTKINRLDFGVTWNRIAEGGGALLGDEVTIEMAIAAVRAPVAGSR